MVNSVRSNKSSSSPSMANLQFKLLQIVRRHQHMKSAFNNLKSQIKTGLIEAEDVFESLSIPLVKLVGLKTKEMAQEGRSSTIFMDPKLHQINVLRRERRTTTSSSRRDRPNGLKEESYSSRARKTGKELVENQHLQLQQLVYLLRQIEAHVNCHQQNILQSLDDHQLSLQKLFQKSVLHLSSIHQTSQNNEVFLVVTVKLLRVIFSHVSSVLGSVQCGVEDLMRKLAENMCSPMVEYVKGLKKELGMGKLVGLVAVVEEMEGMVRHGRLELEETEKRLKIEEERNLAVMSKLKEAEENRRTMKEFVGFLLEGKKGSKTQEAISSQKLLVMGEDHAEEEKLLWDLLREKNKIQAQASPLGPKRLLHPEPNNKYQLPKRNPKSSSRMISTVNHRPVTRSSTRLLGTPSPD